MNEIFDKIKLEMFEVLPGDYEKFVTTDIDVPVSPEELRKLKYRKTVFLLSDFRSIQMGFSVNLKPVQIDAEINYHRSEFIDFFRKLQSNYSWIISEMPVAKELLSPLWEKEFTDDEIMYVFQNYQNIIEKLPSISLTEEEAEKRRKELIDMGCTISE